MSRRIAGALLLLLLACGDDTGPGGGGGGGIRATIDGDAWESDEALTPVVQYTTSGVYVIQGSRLEGGTDASTLLITLNNIPGPGTYPLGTGGGVSGGIGVFAENSSNWSTPLTGAAGTITIDALTDTRIAGTFEFTGGGAFGNAAGTRDVTEGEFDLEVTTSGNVPDLPANAHSRISATLNGTAWNAATVALGANPFGFTASNTQYAIGIGITNVTAPGTFTLGGGGPSIVIAGVTPGDASPTNCCWSSSPGTGSITITTLTATRSTGTFSFTLPADPNTAASGPIVVANGTFDIGRP